MICEYLVSLSTIISIELYLSPVAGFVVLGNLVIKSIVTSSPWRFRWVLILDFAIARMCTMFVGGQLRHFLMYVSTACLMLGNWQCAVKAKGAWLLPGALAVVLYGIFLIHSSILSVGVWSFPFSIGNSCLLADSDPSFLSFSMLWLNESFLCMCRVLTIVLDSC